MNYEARVMSLFFAAMLLVIAIVRVGGSTAYTGGCSDPNDGSIEVSCNQLGAN